jgi:uncharacterized protein YozE (UPF0346 family)
MLKVIIKEVGKAPYLKGIDEGLESMKSIVGGWIEVVPVGGGMCLVCNEEGKLEGLHPNFATDSDIIVGNVFFARSGDDGDFIDVTQQDFDVLLEYLEFRATFVFNDWDDQDDPY